MRAHFKIAALLLALGGGVTLAAAPPPALPVTLSGPARVIDGDTLAIGGMKLRLLATDAPELAQPCERAGVAARCGVEVAEALRRLVDGQAVTCRADRRDRYRRLLATCSVLGHDIEAALVAAGLTFRYPRAPAARRKALAPLEDAARDAGLGLWAPDLVIETPWDWRHRT